MTIQPELYRAVRESAGWWRRDSVGFLRIAGPDRLTWLQGMVSNDTRLLASGQADRLPVCYLDATGHLLSAGPLVTVPARHPLAAPNTNGEGLLLAELPKETVGRILAHLDRLLIMEDVDLSNASSAVGAITLQGPDVAGLPDRLSWISRSRRGATLWAAAEFACRVVPADYTGSGGVDLYFMEEHRGPVEDALNALSAPEIDGDTVETLRIEAGIPRYGMDMDEGVLAPEAGLADHISLTKGCYVGQEIVARIDARGHTNRALTGLVLEGAELPAAGAKLFFEADGEAPRETGRLTSAAADSPAAGGQAIGLGYVRHEHRQPGTRLRIGEGAGFAIVSDLPFFAGPPA